MKQLLLKITVLETQSCVPGHGIKEPMYSFCLQSSKALVKTEANDTSAD